MRVYRKMSVMTVVLTMLLVNCVGIAQMGGARAISYTTPNTTPTGEKGLLWNTTWGVSGTELVMDIATDGQFVFVLGEMNNGPFGGYDIFLLKFTTSGELQDYLWWGGSLNDLGYEVGVDADGNIYIIGGTYNSGAGGCDILVMKLNANFSVCWNITWGGLENDLGKSIAVTPDGMIFVTGYTNSYSATSEVTTLKYNTNGVLLWNRTFWGPGSDQSNAICLGPDRSAYVTGSTSSWQAGGGDFFVLKYDQNGAFQWNQSWRTTYTEDARGIDVDRDENVIIGGLWNQQFLLVKYSPDGTLIANTSSGGATYDDCYDILANDDGTYLLTGESQRSGSPHYDLVLMQFSPDLVSLWNTTWGGPNDDKGCALVKSGDLVFVAGTTTSWFTFSTDSLIMAYYIPPTVDWVPIWIALGITGGAALVVVLYAFLRKKPRKVQEKKR